MIHTLFEGGVLVGSLSVAKLTVFIGLAGANAPLEPGVFGSGSAFASMEADSRSSSSIARPMTPSMHSVTLARCGGELSRPRTLSVLRVVSPNSAVALFSLLLAVPRVEFAMSPACCAVLYHKWTAPAALSFTSFCSSASVASSGVSSATLGAFKSWRVVGADAPLDS